jgi:hypothetical protein
MPVKKPTNDPIFDDFEYRLDRVEEHLFLKPASSDGPIFAITFDDVSAMKRAIDRPEEEWKTLY